MKNTVLFLLLVLTSGAFAKTKPVQPRSFPPIQFAAPPSGAIPPSWQIAEWTAHVKKCVRVGYGPTRSPVYAAVTIGRDGMLVSEPEILYPVDTDDFKADAKRVVAKLHQCEPFIVDPYGRFKGPYRTQFIFNPNPFDPEVEVLLEQYFAKCWTRPETGPVVTAELSYKPDGTFAAPPRALNPEDTSAYSEAVAEVIRQLAECPQLKFSLDQYSEVQKFKWTFGTIESAAKASTSAKPSSLEH